jgi:hypothetical protein
LNLPLQRLVTDQIASSQGVSTDGAIVVSIIQPIQNGRTIEMVSIPTHHGMNHDLFRQRAKELLRGRTDS